MKTIKYNGLEWATENLNKAMTWHDAKEYCKKLGEGWRLPTVKELVNMIDHSRTCPALPEEMLFPSVKSSWYWSSITYAGVKNDAWVVDIDDGGVSGDCKDSDFYVWPVRSIK